MTFVAVCGGTSLVGAILGYLAARRSAPTWSNFNQILVGSLVFHLVAAVLACFVHTNVLLLVVVGATSFLLSFSIFEHCRNPRYPDYPEE